MDYEVDVVAELYLMQNHFNFITEQAHRLNRGSLSVFNNQEMVDRYTGYTKNIPVSAELPGNIKLHKHGSNYLTSKDGIVAHYASFSHSPATKEFPHETIFQNIVDQQPNSPKGAAREALLHIAANSDIPVRTDKEQTDDGHNMWRKAVPEALNRGLRVYHWDGEKLHKTTDDNMEAHLNSYFGDGLYQKHMIISKKEL